MGQRVAKPQNKIIIQLRIRINMSFCYQGEIGEENCVLSCRQKAESDYGIPTNLISYLNP